MDPDDQAPNVASQKSSSMSSGATVMPNYSCLLPAPFDGTTDFEDFVTQFKSVASLSDWENHPLGDLRPQFFSARLSGDALSFYRSLACAQQTNIHRFFHAFRAQYTPNQDVLKAKVKALRQQPGQTIPAFFRELRDLVRNANPVEAVRNEILLTTFIAGLSNPTVRWEVRKAKPADADAALQAAVETYSFLEIDGLKLQTSGVNHISTETPLDTFTEIVRSLRTAEIQDAVAKSSRTDRNASQNNQRDRSESRDSNRYRSPSPGPRRNNNFSNFKKHNQLNEWNTARNSNTQRNNSKVHFSYNSKNNKRDGSSSSQRSDEDKCKHCGLSNHSSRECNACFNCGKIGHFRHECRARRQNIN